MDTMLATTLATPDLQVATSFDKSLSLLDEVPYLFTSEQFVRMVEAEMFPREARVELWDGVIYEKMAKIRPHCTTGAKFNLALSVVKPRGWYLSFEDCLTLDPRKVPLPDLMLIRGEPDDYPDNNPTGPDVGLLVKFSYSSLKNDTGPKLRGYAKAGIPQYWVANLINNVLLVFRDPVSDESRYATAETYRHGEMVPFWLNGVEIAQIAVSDLLPRKQS